MNRARPAKLALLACALAGTGLGAGLGPARARGDDGVDRAGGANNADGATLGALERRHDDARAALAREPLAGPRNERSRALDARRDALARLLQAHAIELDGYATTAPEASATLARARATDARLEALGLAVAAVDTVSVARASELAAALDRTGPEASARAFALRLDAARARGEETALLGAHLARAPEALAAARAARAHGGSVLLLVVSDEAPAAASLARSADDREVAELAASEGPRGLEVARARGSRALGARGARLELLLDRDGRVRGVDLVGAERRALVLALLTSSPSKTTGERP